MKRVFGSTIAVLSALSLVFIACRREEAPEGPHCACEHEQHAGATIEGEHVHGSSDMPALAPLPGTSIYQLESSFTDQAEQPFSLSSLRGGPALVLMFYGSCTSVCPLIISQAQRVEQGLSEDERARLRVVLVTFDPENDTPERLRALASERGMPLSRWSLLRGDGDAVRELAMAIGVQYRRTPDGGFVHSAMVTLLDAEGRVAMQLEGTNTAVEPLTERARTLASGAGTTETEGESAP